MGEELGPCQRARKTLRTISCNPLHHQVLPAMHYERAWKRLYPTAYSPEAWRRSLRGSQWSATLPYPDWGRVARHPTAPGRELFRSHLWTLTWSCTVRVMFGAG